MPEYVLGYARETHPSLESLRQVYFWLHLACDFLAGMCFVVGSVFFLYQSLLTPGTWLFIVGSVLFAAKPTLRLIHELRRRRLIAKLAGQGQLVRAEYEAAR